jgi:flagellar biosynthesis component FlhA
MTLIATAIDEHARLAALVEQIRDHANRALTTTDVASTPLLDILTLIERSEDGLE